MVKDIEWQSTIDTAANNKLVGLAYKIHGSVEAELDHKLSSKGLSRQHCDNKDRRKLSLELFPRRERLVKASRSILTSLPSSLVFSLTDQEKEMLLNFLQTYPIEA